MHASLLSGRQCALCSSGASSRKPAAAAAAPAAAQQRTQAPHIAGPRQVIARVRIDDYDNSMSPSPLAATALQDYMQLEQSGNLNINTVGNLRLKYGIRRGDDGRVQLRKKDGTWMQVKLDMEMQGTILLRNTKDETIHVLQTDRLEQIDLSDDYLLFMLFADPNWEEQILPIQLDDGTGNVSILEMSEQQFKDYVGIIRSLQEASEEAASQLAAARGGAGAVEADYDGNTIDVTAEAAPGGNSSRQ